MILLFPKMDSIQFYNSIRKFPLNKFGNYFDDFKESAFRLETLSIYNVPEESKSFALFTSGKQHPPKDFNEDWEKTIADAVMKKKSLSRIRVIDGLLTTYQRFEILWAYKRSLQLGENIRFIIRPETKPFKTPVPVTKDFWLFDEKFGFIMEYDYCGTFLGVKKIPAYAVNLYVDLKNETTDLSLSFTDALKKIKLTILVGYFS